MKKQITFNDLLDDNGRFISVKQISEQNRIHLMVLYKRIKAKKIITYKLKNSHFIDKQDVYRVTYIASHEKKRALIANYMLENPYLDQIEVKLSLGETMAKPEFFIFQSKL